MVVGTCNLLLLNSKFHTILDFSVTNLPIYVHSNDTDGRNDLILWSDGSYRKMIYNRFLKSYPMNPSVEPIISLDAQTKNRLQGFFEENATEKACVLNKKPCKIQG